MTKFNTGNPIGSSDPRDLFDNASVADKLVNGTEAEYPDRLGQKRKSWAGAESEFNADQSDRVQRFNDFIASSGYEFLGDYTAGIEITEYNQVVRDTSGEFWRASGSTNLPYTTTGSGLPEGGAFATVGDAALRQELDGEIASGGGARLVRGATLSVSSLTELRASENLTGAINLQGYSGREDLGGGGFYADPGDSTSPDNDETVIVSAGGTRYKRSLGVQGLSHSHVKDAGRKEGALLADSGWIWFGKPKAVFSNGKTYYGGVSNEGLQIAASYDHATGATEEFVLRDTAYADIKADDHDQPSVCVLADGRIIYVYSSHSEPDLLRYRISTSAGSVAAFDAEQTLLSSTENPQYATIFLVGTEVFLFYIDRGSASPDFGDLLVLKSTDNGATWSGPTKLLTQGGAFGLGIYFVADTDGTGRVDIAITGAEGPQDNPKRDVRHCYYDGTTIRDASGASLGTLPVSFGAVPAVYDSDAQGNNVWVWDISTHGGKPEIGYAEFQDFDKHSYRHARWDGSWSDRRLTDAGSYIVLGMTKSNVIARERYYSPGISLSKVTPLTAFCGIGDNRSSKIQKWQSNDSGQSWFVDEYSGGLGQNIRPECPINAHEDMPVIWMRGNYPGFESFETDLVFGRLSDSVIVANEKNTNGYVRAYLDTTTNQAGRTVVPFDHVQADARDEWEQGSEGVRIAHSGLYFVSSVIQMQDVSASENFSASLVVSGTLKALSSGGPLDVGSTKYIRCVISEILFLEKGDLVTIEARPDSGGTFYDLPASAGVVNYLTVTQLK